MIDYELFEHTGKRVTADKLGEDMRVGPAKARLLRDLVTAESASWHPAV